MDEIIEIVDEQNRVVGTERRSVVSKKNLLRRAVVLLIIKGKDEFLLSKRSPEKDINPDCWSFSVSGHMMPGESPADAIKRETREELGIDVDTEYVRLFPPAKDLKDYFIYVYITRMEEKSAIPGLDAKEAREIRFWKKADILEHAGGTEKFSPHLLMVFKWLADNGKI
jgi:isopentenyldiphosphate isomerase